jgi:hypothetical protein
MKKKHGEPSCALPKEIPMDTSLSTYLDDIRLVEELNDSYDPGERYYAALERVLEKGRKMAELAEENLRENGRRHLAAFEADSSFENLDRLMREIEGPMQDADAAERFTAAGHDPHMVLFEIDQTRTWHEHHTDYPSENSGELYADYAAKILKIARSLYA